MEQSNVAHVCRKEWKVKPESTAGLRGGAGEREIFPLERQEFAGPQTGGSGDDEEGLEAVPPLARRREERLDLLEGERRPLLFLGHPGRVGVPGGVVRDQALLDSILQRGPDGGVDVANRGNTHAFIQLPLVEVLEILGGEFVELDVPDTVRRYQVLLRVIAVVLQGSRGDAPLEGTIEPPPQVLAHVFEAVGEDRNRG